MKPGTRARAGEVKNLRAVKKTPCPELQGLALPAARYSRLALASSRPQMRAEEMGQVGQGFTAFRSFGVVVESVPHALKYVQVRRDTCIAKLAVKHDDFAQRHVA